MCEKQLGQCFVWTALHRSPSHSFVFTFCFPSRHFVFYDGIWKGNYWSVCIDMIKNISICFAVQHHKCRKYFYFYRLVIFFISCSIESSLVADWWWTVWFDILFTFSQLLNLHPCCRIRATKCVQRTIALYQYKLFNLFPFSVIEFCEVVMFKPWTQYVWSKSGILFFFLTTCATSFRIMTPYFTMWVNKYSAKDSVYLVFARS